MKSVLGSSGKSQGNLLVLKSGYHAHANEDVQWTLLYLRFLYCPMQRLYHQILYEVLTILL